MSIIIKELNKTYKDGVQALKNISLNIDEGIFGLLGPNGAGKTTFMRILATIMNFDSGEIHIYRFNIKNDIYKIRKIIGYLPQEFGLYANINLVEFLDYICLLNEIKDRTIRKKRIHEVIEITNLSEVAMRKIKTYSGGMKRRVGIAQCLINDPRIIIVDEPTAGLDPEERIKYKNLLSLLAKKRIIICSTHIISDLEDICKSIAVIKKGEVIFKGSIEDMIKNTLNRAWIGKCQVDKLSKLENHGLIVNKKLIDGDWEYRIISKEAPFSDSISDIMTVEDCYISLVWELFLNDF